jgi:hypothetical protein
VVPCGAFDGLGMLQQNKGCSSLCGPVAQLGARFHGMEEVIGSIPIRSTTLTPAESKSYSNRFEEQTQKQGHKKDTIKNTIVRDQREKSNAHWNDRWAFLRFPYLLAGLLLRTSPKHASELPACPIKTAPYPDISLPSRWPPLSAKNASSQFQPGSRRVPSHHL